MTLPPPPSPSDDRVAADRGRPGGAAVDRLEELVIDYLAWVLGVRRSLVTRESHLSALGLSSSQMMELVYEMEHELDVVLGETGLGSASTVGDLLDHAREVAATTAGSAR